MLRVAQSSSHNAASSYPASTYPASLDHSPITLTDDVQGIWDELFIIMIDNEVDAGCCQHQELWGEIDPDMF